MMGLIALASIMEMEVVGSPMCPSVGIGQCNVDLGLDAAVDLEFVIRDIEKSVGYTSHGVS